MQNAQPEDFCTGPRMVSIVHRQTDRQMDTHAHTDRGAWPYIDKGTDNSQNQSVNLYIGTLTCICQWGDTLHSMLP